MKTCILSESGADEAAIRILLEAIRGTPLEPVTAASVVADLLLRMQSISGDGFGNRFFRSLVGQDDEAANDFHPVVGRIGLEQANEVGNGQAAVFHPGESHNGFSADQFRRTPKCPDNEGAGHALSRCDVAQGCQFMGKPDGVISRRALGERNR